MVWPISAQQQRSKAFQEKLCGTCYRDVQRMRVNRMALQALYREEDMVLRRAAEADAAEERTAELLGGGIAEEHEHEHEHEQAEEAAL